VAKETTYIDISCRGPRHTCKYAQENFSVVAGARPTRSLRQSIGGNPIFAATAYANDLGGDSEVRA
jgi:hypothetical protein